MSTEAKVKIYKTIVRPFMTYRPETRAETTKTRQTLDVQIDYWKNKMGHSEGHGHQRRVPNLGYNKKDYNYLQKIK